MQEHSSLPEVIRDIKYPAEAIRTKSPASRSITAKSKEDKSKPTNHDIELIKQNIRSVVCQIKGDQHRRGTEHELSDARVLDFPWRNRDRESDTSVLKPNYDPSLDQPRRR